MSPAVTGRSRARRTQTKAFDHRNWLQLVDTDGPFLSVPVLKSVFPSGFSSRWDDQTKAEFRLRKMAFENAWDAADRGGAEDAYRAARDEWVDFVLGTAFDWREGLVDDTSVEVLSPDHRHRVTSTKAYTRNGERAALVLVVDRTDEVRALPKDGWATDQVDRLALLLREAKVPVGVVTDGRWWGLVSAPATSSVASGIVDSQTWVEEADTRDALCTLLHPLHLVGGKPEQRLPQLFIDSVASAEEITESLGAQVRQATELLVQAFSESAAEARRLGEPDPLPADGDEIYSAAVTVMMRVVFLLFAEERALLPEGELFRQAYGLTGQFEALDARARAEGGDSLDSTYGLWHRLLATSRALYQGATFEDLRLPAYGGSLFDPSRFEFMTARTARQTLALRVPDRVMLEVLRAVQFTRGKAGDHRPISFRDIDVEQIGYIYEGLLGYSVKRAEDVIVGLQGKDGFEPEMPLSVLNDLADEHSDDKSLALAIIDWLKKNQAAAAPPTASALAKQLATSDTADPLMEVGLHSLIADEEVREQLRSWHGAIRSDLRGRPTVILPDGLVVYETPSRKNAGAHYTPRSLAEEVVLHALEPLVYSPGPYQTSNRDEWRLKSSDEITALRVADIACGSGAFLVAAARYLADRVVEAWAKEGVGQGSAESQRREALREVVAQCLFGADINQMAVEMCKLSLWLVSLDPQLPFSFVDDKVLVGNSLLGVTDPEQLRSLHIDPSRVAEQPILSMVDYSTQVDIDERLERAKRLRRELSSPVDDTNRSRSGATKKRQYRDFREVTAELRDIGDGVIAAGLRLGGKPGKKLDEAYAALRYAVQDAYPVDGVPDRTALDGIQHDGLTPTVTTDYERWKPLHWVIELPDVFERGGFDAIIGNPPFLGGKKISNAMGKNFREWLTTIEGHGVRGHADLAAYFFLRAARLIHRRGTLGLLATNSIAQGDTREVGLDQMVATGFTITRAIQSRPWPAKNAALEFAAAWGTKETLPTDLIFEANGVESRTITSLLEGSSTAAGNPSRIIENTGTAFIGSNVNCVDAFTIQASSARQMLTQYPALKPILLPYLTGEDLNSSSNCQATRYVFDFSRSTSDPKLTFPGIFDWFEERVRPEREKLRATKPKLAQNWWEFERNAKALYVRSALQDEVLAITLVSKTIMPLKVSARQVFSHMLGVFTPASYDLLATLSSAAHQSWAVMYASTLGSGVRYAPSDVFETFPRPEPTEELERTGKTLDTERREMMLRRNLGLTKLYNLVNDEDIQGDPDIDRLREIHVELDEAVMAAYGWSDVPLNHGFHTYRQMTRWTVCPEARVEILDRLLEENHRRAALQSAPPPPADESDDE